MTTELAPFSALTPDIILNALDSVGLKSDGRLLALNSYENRVYQIGIENAPAVVVKFYRPGRWTDAAILEEHAFLNELAEVEIPVVPALAFADQKTLNYVHGFRFSVFPKQGGRVPELESRTKLEWMGRLIGRIHATGAIKPFLARPTLDIEHFGEEPRSYLLHNHFVPDDLATIYHDVSAQTLEGVRQCFERADQVTLLRLHGDCYPGNMLWTDDGPHFVDFDDSRMGPAIQDLWMLLCGNRAEMQLQLNHLLAGYQTFCDFNHRERYLIEALRSLRLIHYAAWIARRWHDPAFPSAFPWFNTHRYWQERIVELREQCALMDEEPL
ncbi:MAG: serine/threonine protein kinase [Methylovulum sp.]|nr:serine/threonine protein kinase [Methylovulum sp.]